MAGRPLEFDRDQALARAMDAFHCYGYEGLPTAVLAEEMGLSKSSLYNSFGTKRELLLESLAAYADVRATTIRKMAGSPDVLGQMRALLVDIAQNNDDGMGCFLVNTAAELGQHDFGVRQLLQSCFQSVVDAFELLVLAGQRSGELKRDLNSARAALMIVTNIAGLRVLAKAGVPPEHLTTAIEHPLTLLAA